MTFGRCRRRPFGRRLRGRRDLSPLPDSNAATRSPHIVYAPRRSHHDRQPPCPSVRIPCARSSPVGSGAVVAPQAQAAAQAAAATSESKAAQLDRLYVEFWEASLKLNPLQATFQGDNRYNDQLPNFLTEASRKEAHAFTVHWLERAEAIGPDGLGGQDRLSYDIFVKNAKDTLEGESFPNHLMPIDQFNNIAAFAAQLGSGSNAQPFRTVKDYDDWRARGGKMAPIFDQAIVNMREGMRQGVVQPKVLMQKVLPQFDALIADQADKTLFWGPIKNMPATFSDTADKTRIAAEYRTMIEQEIMPAYRRMREFIANEYLPACRDTAGMGGLPNGQAWYAFNAYLNTTTRRTPAQMTRPGSTRSRASTAKCARSCSRSASRVRCRSSSNT